MAGSMTNFLEQEIADQLLGASAYATPATYYFGLFTVVPSDSGAGTEVSGNAYARQAYTNNLAGWTPNPANSTGTKANANVVTFPAATPATWGTIVAVGIFDTDGTTGNLLFWMTLTATKVVAVNDIFTLPAGSVVLVFD